MAINRLKRSTQRGPHAVVVGANYPGGAVTVFSRFPASRAVAVGAEAEAPFRFVPQVPTGGKLRVVGIELRIAAALGGVAGARTLTAALRLNGVGVANGTAIINTEVATVARNATAFSQEYNAITDDLSVSIVGAGADGAAIAAVNATVFLKGRIT